MAADKRPADQKPAFPDQANIQIDTPLPESLDATGRIQSIGDLINGSPLFPPFEGLEESYWREQTCSNCHSWDKPELCKQGEFYIGADEAAVSRIRHPYGGFFKSALKVWAASACR